MQCKSSPVAAGAALVLLLAVGARTYDPDDAALATVLPPAGSFEPFYARAAFGAGGGSASAGAGAGAGDEGGDEEDDGSESVRAPHAHATFYKHRHPALVDAKNAAAYGFRFDGGRRFNYD
ncbi:hypothetical protein R5R35_006382 [Gryllus longicercus]|uniref:Accessory gland protein n=1 Tax=Gryllus longicercus TaxID=2509291 RepID=A0AAN9ZGB1_9ORTH